jgi:chromosome segregation ATPase
MKRIIAILLSVLVWGCSEKRSVQNPDPNIEELNGIIFGYKTSCEKMKEKIDELTLLNEQLFNVVKAGNEAVATLEKLFEAELKIRVECVSKYNQLEDDYNRIKEELDICNRFHEMLK